MQDAKDKGESYRLPRINELLGQPEFTALNQWLSENDLLEPASLQQLQDAVDQFEQQAQQGG